MNSQETVLAVLAAGEPMVELSASETPGLWHLGFAGDTLNTAWYLRRLLPPDQAVGYLTRVGQGGFSRRMVQFIADAGIVTDHVGTDPQREVGLYAIDLDQGERSFTYWRGASAARGLADDPKALARAFGRAQVIYFSGITTAILPPAGRENLACALTAARTRGAQVVFDPNIRPKLWEEAEIMRAQITRFAGLSDLVLPSMDDESLHFGDVDPQATIARYLAAGAGQVVVKAGGGPVHYGGQAQGCVEALGRVAPVDTTAAGDSFNAGFLAARLAGEDIEQAIRAGHAVAMQVIGARGALVEIQGFSAAASVK